MQGNHLRICAHVQEGLPHDDIFAKPTLHELRHTAATIMLSNGIPIKVVSDILGHSKTETTLNIYQHVSADLQRSATDALEALLDATTLTPQHPKNGTASG